MSGRGVTPAQAAWRNSIPFDNFCWMFVVNAALTDGIHAMLARKGHPAIAGVCVVYLVQIELAFGLTRVKAKDSSDRGDRP